MKRLTLMRHADAQWKDPEVDDFARPLNRRGHTEAESMARRHALAEVVSMVVQLERLRAEQEKPRPVDEGDDARVTYPALRA